MGTRPRGRRRRQHPGRCSLVEGPACAWGPSQEGGRAEADTRRSAGHPGCWRRKVPPHSTGAAHRDRQQSPASLATLFLVGAWQTPCTRRPGCNNVRTHPAAHKRRRQSTWGPQPREAAAANAAEIHVTASHSRNRKRGTETPPPPSPSLAHDPVRGAPLHGEGGTGGGVGGLCWMGGPPAVASGVTVRRFARPAAAVVGAAPLRQSYSSRHRVGRTPWRGGGRLRRGKNGGPTRSVRRILRYVQYGQVHSRRPRPRHSRCVELDR